MVIKFFYYGELGFTGLAQQNTLTVKEALYLCQMDDFYAIRGQ